nr:hypothetical protein [Tanacetum cinerariifolium]
SELIKDDREYQLYDEFKHFRQHKGENIQDYYIRFTKLINSIRHIKMTMPKTQLNSKFVNNMLPKWGRFMTAVKLNMVLKESNHDRLQHKGENIQDYYIRFTKLINSIRHIKMTMPKTQLNSKFVNNMLPKWGRFLKAVKLNMVLKESNHDRLYAYLKQQDSHSNDNKMLMERFNQHSHDPLDLVSNALPYQYPSSSSVPPQSLYISSITFQPQFTNNTQLDIGCSPTNKLLDNLTKQVALLTQQYKTQFPQTNNQLRTSSNTRNQAIVQNGRVVVQNVQGRQNMVQGNNARGNVAIGNRRAQNRASNANARQGQLIKCYKCNRLVI